MSHIYTIPLVEGDQYDRQTHTPPLPYNFFYQEANDGVLQKEHMMVSGSSDGLVLFPTNESSSSNDIVKQSLGDLYVVDKDLHGSNKWMSSKMRFIKKMMEFKPRRSMQVLVQDEEGEVLGRNGSINNDKNNNNNNSPIGIIRVCSDCNTTKTPLWRSGPRGPKSLCNACGIRQRKARRALAAAAAAAAANGGLIRSDTHSKVKKEKRADHGVDRTVPFKKRCKNFPDRSNSDQTNACFADDVTINLSKNPAFHRVFPQDERDAAILLMALSCGPVS
ncbi:protein CYTOKININ-RESPONSIVE GATA TRANSCRIPTION FACTOR 1-like isoform X1 [Typha angustifolia]|uniref:protein CYTOKININ-RESPONSIVE GATA TRANSCRIPTION FACTOR 1-like isoform X1 n=1 Tax=Typha angustifolia TaxID=59011 RepID=UPI003C2C4DC2